MSVMDMQQNMEWISFAKDKPPLEKICLFSGQETMILGFARTINVPIAPNKTIEKTRLYYLDNTPIESNTQLDKFCELPEQDLWNPFDDKVLIGQIIIICGKTQDEQDYYFIGYKNEQGVFAGSATSPEKMDDILKMKCWLETPPLHYEWK